jgi:hypothetical protein
VVSPKRFAKIAREEANKGMFHIYAVVCQSQPLDNLPGYTITRIAATIIADSKTEKEALIRDFPKVTEIPEAQIPVKGVEHAIETTKNPPFRTIYNCWIRSVANEGIVITIVTLESWGSPV